MQKKLTITIEEQVYAALYQMIGRRHISKFIEELIKTHLMPQALEAAYREMAEDEEREREAMEWSEAHVRDHETW